MSVRMCYRAPVYNHPIDRSMTRAQYHAARRELHQLGVAIASHRLDSDKDDCSPYQVLKSRQQKLIYSIPYAGADPHGIRILLENQSRRRHNVLYRLRVTHAAARLDITGLPPIKAAMARIEATWGCA